LVWVAAIQAKEILGFALIHPHSVESEILSFKIHPNHRQQGVAKVFLQQIELLCASRNIQSLKILYRTYWENNLYWEKVLQQSNWDNRSTLLYYISLDQAVQKQIAPSFQSKNWKLKDDYQIKTFSYDCLLATMPHSKWQEAKKTGLSPLQLPESKVDLDCSFLILEQNTQEVVGWLICHQLQANILQLTTFYILPEHRKVGKAVIAKLSTKISANDSKLHFMVKVENLKIMAFVRRYLLSQEAQCSEQVLIRKTLSL